MRYPPGRKQQTHGRLLDLSSELSKRGGFSAMSVDELMAAAGLTGGAFYAHFDSKDALFAELMKRELSRSAEMLSPREGESREAWLAHTLDSYLNEAHVQHPASGCVIPALGPEIARAQPQVRRAYESAMTRLHRRWAERLGDAELAWAAICQLVGTIVVARAMASPKAASAVVQASRAQLGRVKTKPLHRQHPSAKGKARTRS